MIHTMLEVQNSSLDAQNEGAPHKEGRPGNIILVRDKTQIRQ